MKHIGPFLLLLGFSIIVFLAHFLVVGTAVYGDGRYYYSYLPTFYVDHSFNFVHSFAYFGIQGQLNPSHIPTNIYAIGPAVVWALPYLLAYFLMGATNPYSLLLQIVVGVFNCSLVIIGLYLIYQTLIRFFSTKTALFTIIALFLATNLFFYGAIDVINSHSVSFFFASILLYAWAKGKNSFFNTIITGIAIGMLMLIRTQDIIFLVLPFITFITNWEKRFLYFCAVLGIVSIFSMYQAFLWQGLWGNALKSPYLYHNYFTFLTPHILGVLFNPTSGLFLWTPIVAFALWGLYGFTHKQPHIAIPIAVAFFAELYIISSWNIWWEGASYSGRMFISSLPFLALGLAHLLEQNWLKKYSFIFVSGFSILNFILMLFFLLKVN